MERHKCKLCSKSFSNGKALGGHMRSHLATLPIPPKNHQLSIRTESTSFSSRSSSSEDEIIQEPEQEQDQEEVEEKGLVYGLRKSPKRSFRLADPGVSFTVDDAGFVVQDRESETESRNPTRKRSNRNRRVGLVLNQVGSQTEPEPASSVSDTSPDEDVAMCLMMLSRDIYDKSNDNIVYSKKYKCEPCKRVFPTFQALGGHRASHKKMKSNKFFQGDQTGESRNTGNFIGCVDAIGNGKVHECPVCYKVFGSGQALGGHKKSHFLKSKTRISTAANCDKVGGCLIDLNLPASMEEDEVSALSCADFNRKLDKNW